MSKIRESLVNDLKARVNLGEVAGQVVALKKCGGDDLVGLCPFHAEKTPSFHVHPEKGFFKCFGCGKSGDVIDFVAETENLSFTKAVEALGARFNCRIEYEDGTVGTSTGDGGTIQRAVPRPIETRAPSPTWLRLQPALRPGTITELSALAALRRFPAIIGLEFATRAGHLWFADVWDDGFEWPAWILTDGSRRNAQARRCDGQPWAGIGGKKAKTIAGCEATWPVGITEAADRPVIFMVEGAPDLLAAWHLIWLVGRTKTTAPVAMFGAANPVHPEALALFAGKDIRIFPHNDANLAGMNGAIRWRSQLLEAGARAVGFFDFRPEGNKDLNDLITQYGIPELKEVS